MLKPRLKLDSTKSPIDPKMITMIPNTNQCVNANSGNSRHSPQATMSVNTAAPREPSQVFLGEIFGKSGVLPNLEPTKYALVSEVQVISIKPSGI